MTDLLRDHFRMKKTRGLGGRIKLTGQEVCPIRRSHLKMKLTLSGIGRLERY